MARAIRGWPGSAYGPEQGARLPTLRSSLFQLCGDRLQVVVLPVSEVCIFQWSWHGDGAVNYPSAFITGRQQPRRLSVLARQRRPHEYRLSIDGSCVAPHLLRCVAALIVLCYGRAPHAPRTRRTITASHHLIVELDELSFGDQSSACRT